MQDCSSHEIIYIQPTHWLNMVKYQFTNSKTI